MTSFSHLAFLLPSLHGGGAERSIMNLAVGFTERCEQVDLVLVHHSGSLKSDLPTNLRMIDLRTPRAFTSRALSSLPALFRYLRREKPDLLFTGLMMNLIALWAKHLAAVPTKVVISERNMLSLEVKQFPKDIRFRILPLLVKKFYPYADGIVAVSRAVALDLIQLTGITEDKIHVIFNPVITGRVKAGASKPLEHPWFSIGSPPVILSVGRLVPQKNYPTLLKAFALIRQKRAARLLILGEGEQRNVLEELAVALGIEADMQLPGFVENPYPYMKAASVFVLPSLFEGLPGVLIEALFCGAQVIATDCPGGSREVLANGEYGKLVAKNDPAALADAIEFCLENRTHSLSSASWLQYEQDHILDQYSTLFTQTCNGVSTRPENK